MNVTSEVVESKSKDAEKSPSAEAEPTASPEAPRTTGDAPLDMTGTLARLRAAQRKHPLPDYDTRIDNLDRLEKVLLKHKDDAIRAISADFGNRSKHETLISEIFLTLSGLRHARQHLAEWMQTEAREVNWVSLPARAELVKQPLGVVGIISPWNYPLNLALSPLVYVLAAGNRAMIKPSELVPETAALLAKMMKEALPDHVVVVEGGIEVGQEFAGLPFDHLVFTGSTSVGKHVMRAAAENLVPVTLELGGKSPAIVAEGYSLKAAAEKIMRGKIFNAGQTCIAPDYVLLPKGRVDAFVEECKSAVRAMFPSFAKNDDYTSIVNERHYDRLQGYLADAESKGGKLVPLTTGGEELTKESRKIAPTLVVHAKDEMTVLQDEIFGPILPIVTYESFDHAIDYVNDRPRPLALYYFDHDAARTQRILTETTSGGVAVNETLMHIAQDDLPFGGVGPSGMGHYHGREGFDTFTKQKAVLHQARLNGVKLLQPPYGKAIDTLLRFLIG